MLETVLVNSALTRSQSWVSGCLGINVRRAERVARRDRAAVSLGEPGKGSVVRRGNLIMRQTRPPDPRGPAAVPLCVLEVVS